MKRWIFLFILLVLSAGCINVPFQETTWVPLGSEDPQSMVERFQEGLPASFQLLTTIVFEYNRRKFSAIGYVDINANDEVFNVVCMNPMGVKLFELSGDRNSVTNRYTIAAFTRYGDITSVVGNDIRRIYFGLRPSVDAAVWKSKYQIRFRQPAGAGIMEYVYAGQGGNLIEKNYYEDQGLIWRVSYYEYRQQNGKRYPGGIVFINYQYGYRLTVRQKEFRT